ncbi:MAG: diguanylate cyclase [Spirochaetota bacterium]
MTAKILVSSLLFLSSAILLSLCMIIIIRKKVKERKYLLLLLLAFAIYTIGYTIEIQGQTLQWVHISLIFEYIGISFLPAFLILLALSYLTDIDRIPLYLKFFIYVIPIITFIVVLTDPYHNLLHKNPFIDYSGPFPVVSFEKGIWYWVHIVYYNVALLISNIIFLRIFIKSHSRFKKQTVIIFLSTLIPWITMFIYLSGIITWPLDINPFSFTIMAIILYIGVKKQYLIDILPIARDLVFENIYDAAFVLDNNGLIIDYNRSAENILSNQESIIGKNIKDVLNELSSSINDNQDLQIVTETTINERIYNIQNIPLTSIKNKSMGYIFLLRDITEYRMMAEKLQKLAITDELTGIYNRRKFNEVALREFNRAKRNKNPLSIIIMDIDYFKIVNDTYGHAIGDDVLKTIAKSIAESLRSLDIFARYGGEEFIICLPETSIIAAQNVAERIRSCINDLTFHDKQNNQFKISLSLGVSQIKEYSQTIEDIIRDADKALYEAKSQGRNKVVVSD